MDSLDNITEHLLRFAPDALIVVDERGQIRYANEAVQDLFGYAPRELIGGSLDLLIPERLRSRHAAHVAGFIGLPRNRDMAVAVPDLAARRRDGSEFPASIRLGYFQTRRGTYVTAAIRDITERTRAHAAVVAAREEADRANRAKSRFLASASHDLRQPLQTIRLLNAAMLKVTPHAELRDLLVQQNQAIEGATRMLNALLDISRLESGAIEAKFADLSLPKIFDELRNEFGAVAIASGVALRISAPALTISTDRTLFYQLLQNVVGNALKYTDHGAVTVSAQRTGDGLTVLVEDTGIGIPPDKIDRIFDEYYQVDAQGAKRMGVGLGLAIVKEVAQLLGYGVRIESQPGQGTQVRVDIPNRFVVAAAAPSAPVDAPQLITQAGAPRARLILVEDHESVRRATELFLKVEGFETLTAASAADAQKLLSQLRPNDVLIADYHLDGRHTGIDLLMWLRERSGRATPGVIMSGDLPSVMRTVHAPPDNCRFLSKPVDTTALLQAIDELSRDFDQEPTLAAQVASRSARDAEA